LVLGSFQHSAFSRQENQTRTPFGIELRFWFAYTSASGIPCDQDCNHDSEKNLFRKLFPKQIPDIHKARARTISFALVHNSSETKLRQLLNGDY
jgi:hypothetical protein